MTIESAPAAVALDQRGTIRLFEAQAAKTPDRLAVTGGSQRYTYTALNQRAQAISRHILARDVATTSPIAILLERNADSVAAVLGVWKSGRAYVPIDPTTPRDRIEFILQDSGAGLVLTQESLIEKLPTHVVSVCNLTDLTEPPPDEAESHTADAPDAVAYIIYTSGTTGKPKGVVIEHRSILNLAWGHRERIYNHHDPEWRGMRASLNASLAFDGSVERILLLLFGYSLFVTDEETRRDPVQFIKFARDNALEVLDVTPSFLSALVQSGLFECDDYRPQVVLVGGEAIDASLWRRLAQSSIAFYNVYGPTETTVNAAVCRIEGAEPRLGTALPNLRIYVLDETRRPVPPGVAGEIHVSGAGVARGYLGRDDLTREKFIPNPFAPADHLHARLYRTGDVGRWLPDGTIQFLGRSDSQIKVRGYRIELNEIESALLTCPGISQAVVVAHDYSPGDRRLIAYVVAGTGSSLEIRAIRSHVGRLLPEYMVPSAILILDKLPLTQNGKVDRDLLPLPQARPDLTEYVPTRDSTEETLARIWSAVLRIERVGVHDNFFELGGDSNLGIQVIARARRAGLKLSASHLFTHQTVAELSKVAQPIDRPLPGG